MPPASAGGYRSDANSASEIRSSCCRKSGALLSPSWCGSGPVGVAHCGLLLGGGWSGWPGWVRSSWCRASRAPLGWWLVGLAGWVRSSWCRASRAPLGWWLVGLAGWVRSSWCRASRAPLGWWLVGLAGWVRSSWCRASRAPLGWWLVGLAGVGQVQLVSRIAGSSWVVAGRVGRGGSGPVRVAHRGLLLGGGGGVGRGGSGPVRVAHRGLLSGGGWSGWPGWVRSSSCRASRAPVRWWLVGLAGVGQVQFVSRIAGSCSVVAGRVGRGGSGPVRVAHRGLLSGGGWSGWPGWVRSSSCRASRAPVRWWLVGLAGVGQVQLVSRIAGSCPVVAGRVGRGGSGPVRVAHRGLLSGGGWSGWPGWVRSSWCRASRAPVRWWLVGLAGVDQVQLVSRIAGSCPVVAGGVGRGGSGPVRVAHRGLLSGGGWLGEGTGGRDIGPSRDQACIKMSLSTHLNPLSDCCKRPF